MIVTDREPVIDSLTVDEAAEVAKVTPATIRRWITHGTKGVQLQAVRLGHTYRIPVGALEGFGTAISRRREQNAATPAAKRRRIALPPISTATRLRRLGLVESPYATTRKSGEIRPPNEPPMCPTEPATADPAASFTL